jgi:hypothetical protein
MKRRQLPGLALAVLCTAMAFMSSASAHEGRKLNGYWLYLGFASEPAFEDEINGPVVFVNNLKQKPVKLKELNDKSKNDLTVEALYYGLKDTKKNLTAKPKAKISLGKMSGAFEGFMQGPQFVASTPGAYGFRVTGLLNGKNVDTTFVCSRGSLNLAYGYFDCVNGPYVAPGPRIRGWWPN